VGKGDAPLLRREVLLRTSRRIVHRFAARRSALGQCDTEGCLHSPQILLRSLERMPRKPAFTRTVAVGGGCA
jgi:hypothetical protein